jgi:predicted ATPase
MPDINTIKTVQVTRLHGQMNLYLHLSPHLNIIFGRNGTGKTTVLHIIANVLHGEFFRFIYLAFDKISVTFLDGSIVGLRRYKLNPVTTAVDVSLGEEVVATVSKESPQLTPSAVERLASVIATDPVYLPAFRTILEATGGAPNPYAADMMAYEYTPPDPEIEWLTQNLTALEARKRGLAESSQPVRDRARMVATKTTECRRWFGQFTPIITYPSIRDVQKELSREIRDANQSLAAHDRSALSTSFVQVLTRLLASDQNTGMATRVPELLTRVKAFLEEMTREDAGLPSNYAQLQHIISSATNASEQASDLLAAILELYANTLEERLRTLRGVFRRLRQFSESANRFLETKQLVVQKHRMAVLFGQRHQSLDTLSSGERHVLTLLFAATHMSKYEGVLLVDEPELSLHVEWQRVILSEIMKQAPGRQIIVCTHAPEITALQMRSVVEIASMPSDAAAPEVLWPDETSQEDA